MRFCTLFIPLLSAIGALGQSTPNPDCAHAIPLEVSSTNIPAEWSVQNIDVIDPGPMDPPSACASGNQEEAWFSFVATATKHWVRLAPTGAYFRIELFSGACGSLTSLLCTPTQTTAELADLSVGTTYHFRVFNLQTGSENGIAVFSMAANNDCTTARELFPKAGAAPVLPSTPASTYLATQSAPSVPPAANDDVWYRFTATADKHFISSSWTTNEDVITQYYSGTCGNLTPTYFSGLTIGQTYYVQQYTESNNANVFVDGWTDLYTAAPNDECAGAIPVHVTLANEEPVPFNYSNLACSSSDVTCYTENFDVWYSFEAPSQVVHGISSGNWHWGLYSGSCGSLTCVTNEIGGDVEFADLVVGQTYLLKVGSNVAYTNASIILTASATNDDCADAMLLDIQPGSEPEDWVNANTYGTTQSMPGCAGVNESNDDVWFRFTAQDTAQFLHLRATHDDPILRVELFEGDCAAPQSLFCSAQFNAFADKVRFSGLVPGNEYRFRVYTTSGGYAFLRLALTHTLANDGCAGAVELTSTTLEAFNTLPLVDGLSATDGTGTCATTNDIWYRFTATGGAATFLAPPQAAMNVELLTGTCGDLASVACRSNVSRAGFNGLVAGQVYFLRYAAPDAPRTRPILFLTPPNDEVGNALMLQPGGSTFATQVKEAWTFGATRSLARLCGTQGTPDDDVWFKFQATQAAHTISVQDQNLRFALTPLQYGLIIEAYDPLALDSASLAADVLGCGTGSLALNGLTIGHTIYFRVYSNLNTANDVTAFLVSISSGNNDEASGAMPIGYATDYTVLYDTDGATQSRPAANCSVDDFSDDDIWFRFTANGGPGRVISSHHDADLTLELFSGTPGDLTSVACSDNILVLPDGLASGQTYYVRLYSWRNGIDVSGRLGLFASPSLTANNCVDEDCLGPVLLENPGIEQGGYCAPVRQLTPGGDGITGAPVAPGWYDHDYTTADSYSSCSDFDGYLEVPQRPSSNEFHAVCSRNGKGMGGFFGQEPPDYREYHTSPLTSPLVPGEPYLVSFYLNMRVLSSDRPINGFGALLTTGIPVGKYDMGPQVLDLHVIEGGEWKNICGVVVADQAYDHITIGNFIKNNEMLYEGNPANSSYYFLDDVVVAHIDDASCITSVGDLPAAHDPYANGSGDDLHLYPNPANDRVNIVGDAGLFGKHAVVEVFDVTGKRVHAGEVSRFQVVQPMDLSAEWKEGLYLVMVRVEGQAPRSARLVLKR